MGTRKKAIEPSIILTIDMHNPIYVLMVVRTILGDILEFSKIIKFGSKQYKIRKDVIDNISNLIQKHNIDTIIIQQNKLFIDKIDRHPDPIVLRDITLGFGIQTSIEDNFYNKVKYILALPDYEWRNTILNKSVKYSIDLYKSHILEQSLYYEYRDVIDSNNYYEALCLSESVIFDNLMDRKYQINKGD